jgi:hypothetical protein
MPPAKKAAPRKRAAAPKSEKTSAQVSVWVPRGSVRRDEILHAALLAAEIPMAAMHIKPTVTGASDVKKDENGEEGREYAVTITWTPRPKRAATVEEEDEVPGTIDKVLGGLAPLTAEQIGRVVDEGQEA